MLSQIIGGVVVIIGLLIFVFDFKSMKNYFKKMS